MRPEEEDLALTPEQEDRAVALAVARELLLVKAGKFAERALDPYDVITVAEWILGDVVADLEDVMAMPVSTPLTMQQAAAIRKALRDYDRQMGDDAVAAALCLAAGTGRRMRVHRAPSITSRSKHVWAVSEIGV